MNAVPGPDHPTVGQELGHDLADNLDRHREVDGLSRSAGSRGPTRRGVATVERSGNRRSAVASPSQLELHEVTPRLECLEVLPEPMRPVLLARLLVLRSGLRHDQSGHVRLD